MISNESALIHTISSYVLGRVELVEGSLETLENPFEFFSFFVDDVGHLVFPVVLRCQFKLLKHSSDSF